MGALWRAGTSALLLVAIMVVGSLVLWVGIPVAWLWIAGRIEGATGNLGAAVGAAFFGFIVSTAAMIPVLSGLSNAYRRRRVVRGLPDPGHFALETVMTITAGVVVVGFTAWFLLFAGTSPVPFSGGH